MGGARSSSGYARTMMPESVRKLASYIYVDKALLLKLSETGLQPERVDEIRAILLLNQTPGFDISSPLDAYDALVMEIATTIVEENRHLIEEEIRGAVESTLGIGVPEELPEITPEEEALEKRKAAAMPRVKPEAIFVPSKKVKQFNKKTRRVTFRAQPVAWRQRGQEGLSEQEAFVYARKDQPAKTTQREFAVSFRVFRSQQSIKTKQNRISKRIALGQAKEKSTGGPFP